MAHRKFTTEDLLDFFCEYIKQSNGTVGMKAKAAQFFGVDRKTITLRLNDMRQQRRLGRDVFRRWRDSCDEIVPR